MRITKRKLRALIREALESGPSFAVPAGFTDPATVFRGNSAGEYRNIQKYAADGIKVPEVGTYATNNGYIAAVDSAGQVHIHIPSSQGRESERMFSYRDVINQLEALGFREAQFYVPGSSQGLQ